MCLCRCWKQVPYDWHLQHTQKQVNLKFPSYIVYLEIDSSCNIRVLTHLGMHSCMHWCKFPPKNINKHIHVVFAFLGPGPRKIIINSFASYMNFPCTSIDRCVQALSTFRCDVIQIPLATRPQNQLVWVLLIMDVFIQINTQELCVCIGRNL